MSSDCAAVEHRRQAKGVPPNVFEVEKATSRDKGNLPK